jgi:hypothetical protein
MRKLRNKRRQFLCQETTGTEARILTKGIRRINDEKESAHSKTIYKRGFRIRDITSLYNRVIQVRQRDLSSEGLGSSNCGDYFFCEGSCISYCFE